MKTFREIKDFDEIRIQLASPEAIVGWSYGEVTKPETINYRTGRSERGGLFDERIFGPDKDFECYCGKYRRIRYKGIVCEKCGVEVTRSEVRRERMGHISLASPVAHIWFLRGVPSRMSILLGMSINELEKVIYFAGYMITKIDEEEKKRIKKELEAEYKTKLKIAKDDKSKEEIQEHFSKSKEEINSLKERKVLTEAEFHNFSLRYGACFEAETGAETVYNIFKNMDLKKEKQEAGKLLEKAGTSDKRKYQRRLSLIRSMVRAKLRPEWMFLTTIPVIPPALRPMVALDGGRHATSDLNDLYRRVLNRNNRLKKLKELGAPEVILRNEKRILQEAVDSLIDNSITRQTGAQAMSQAQRRALKSLADNLKGKRGLFRQNLLGKRVDYSGRSVIVVGPQLRLSQCGLPKHMALELFRPFVISRLIASEMAYNIRGANRLIEEGVPEVWAILEEVIQGKYVLLNRAPTLHRLGIQAFNPILIEGNAIQVHPLVCTAFNADFDGDMMAVHVPLSKQAQTEAQNRMAATRNLLKPQSGDPIITPKLDMVLGCFWMTKIVPGKKGEGSIFSSPNQAIAAYDFREVDLQSKIRVLPTDKTKYKKFRGKLFETSVGRLLFNSSLPEDHEYINEEVTSKKMSVLIDDLIRLYPDEDIPKILDKIKDFGFEYVTRAGITWGIDDIRVPEGKKEIIESGRREEREIVRQYNQGLLSEEERYRKVLEVWEKVKDQIQNRIPKTLAPHGPVNDMIRSGARGSIGQVTQMAGMKGIIVNPAGREIDFPIIPSYKEGLSPIEYFVSTHGARKGLADTALKTASAGYLTRRLVDVAQDVVITEEDCKTRSYKIARKENISGIELPLWKNLCGRILADNVKGDKGKVLFKKGELMTKQKAMKVEESGVEEVKVRTPLTCKTVHGLCRMCYGLDMARNFLVEIGEAVGIIAAQAIGEPGTQLTLRTFHTGGVAGGADITHGLPRVEEVFERRIPKIPAVVSSTSGLVTEVNEKERKITILSEEAGRTKKKKEIEYEIPYRRRPRVKKGEKVEKGDFLTDGSADISEVFAHGGQDRAEEYIVREILKVYELQGASTARKHFEVIVRQMFSRRKIKDPGDSVFSAGDIVEAIAFIEENERVKKEGGKEAKAETVILGISEVSLTTESWLSAASFQNTNRVLITNAVRGGIDTLRGLKENVIIGRLIPTGTGYSKK